MDTDIHRILQEMLADANGVTEGTTQRLPDKVLNREVVADTGATVVCGGNEIGLTLEQLLPTNLTLFTADKNILIVLGAVPVIITWFVKGPDVHRGEAVIGVHQPGRPGPV